MKRLGIAAMWLVLGAVTFFVALVYSGCGSTTKPSTVKPEPRQTQDAPYVCLRVEREGKSDAVFCGSQGMCSIAHANLVAYWDVLKTRYGLTGLTGLSDCTPVDVRFTER